MLPGQHVIIIGTEVDALRARASGLSLRDTVLIVLPGITTMMAYLFRAPIEGTIVENVIKHGCGALNIDGCRIQAGRKQKSAGATTSESCYGEYAGVYEKGTGRIYTSEGRWPTNLVLVHGPGCREAGTRCVHGSHSVGQAPAYYQEKGRTAYGTFQGHRPTTHVGENGLETVAAWECQSDCPVRVLDNLSGNRKSAYVGNPEGAFAEQGAARVNPQRGNVYAPGLDTKPCGVLYSDNGGASRFYPQFPDLRAALVWLDRLAGLDQAAEAASADAQCPQ